MTIQPAKQKSKIRRIAIGFFKFVSIFSAVTTILVFIQARIDESPIVDAVETACMGRPATSPEVGGSKEQSVRARLCPNAEDGIELQDVDGKTYNALPKNSISLPAEMKATSLRNLRYVVSVEEVISIRASCQYVDFHTMTIQGFSAAITVYDAITGARVSRQELSGTGPKGCPSYSGTNLEVGSPVSVDEIQETVISLLSSLISTPALDSESRILE